MSNWLSLTQKELAKISNRLNKTQKNFNEALESVNRDSDDCWQYADAEKKYDRLFDIGMKLEDKISDLEDIQEALNELIKKVDEYDAKFNTITISNINEKWEGIKSKLSPNTIKVVNNASFLDLAERWEDLKKFADEETIDLVNRLLKMINDEVFRK